MRKGNKPPGEREAQKGAGPAAGDPGPSASPAWRGWARGARRAAAVLAVVVLGSVPFWIWPLDLAVSGKFYSPLEGWVHKEKETLLWQLLYDFGVIPSVLVVVGALVVFAGSWRVTAWRRYRKIAGYLILCMALGPGLVINVCLKDGWGRPRPQAVEPFGGRYAFEPVLTVDPSSPGKSFPCGHCSMGFYLFSVAMLAGWRTRAGIAAAAGAACFGMLIGMARIVQGGHFLSDVWWAAGLCLATSVLLFHGMGLERSRWYEPAGGREGRKLPASLGAGLGIGLVALLAAVLVASPYRCDEVYAPRLGTDRAFRLVLQLEGDQHEVVTGGELRIEVRGSGQGVPGSAVKSELFERHGAEEWKGQRADLVLFRQRYSGWFREVEHATRVTLPRDLAGRVDLEIRSGELQLKGGPPAAPQEWRVTFPAGGGRINTDPRLSEPGQGAKLLNLQVAGAGPGPEPPREAGGAGR